MVGPVPADDKVDVLFQEPEPFVQEFGDALAGDLPTDVEEYALLTECQSELLL